LKFAFARVKFHALLHCAGRKRLYGLNYSMKKCLFCPNPANSLEHVLPQWLFRCIAPQSQGTFPVQVGRYVEGKGYQDRRNHISLSFKARIVCTRCNTGWMRQLESNVAHIFQPLAAEQFPVFAHDYFNKLKDYAPTIAFWLSKTALTTSFALPGRQCLAESLAPQIAQKQAPRGVWIDVAKAKVAGIGAALTKMFPTINGNVFTGVQTHTAGECFQFCLQINHLLLRVGMSSGAEVGYVAPEGLMAFRLFPDADPQVPERCEFQDINHFLHSIVLRTWAGCPGEVPAFLK